MIWDMLWFKWKMSPIGSLKSCSPVGETVWGGHETSRRWKFACGNTSPEKGSESLFLTPPSLLCKDKMYWVFFLPGRPSLCSCSHVFSAMMSCIPSVAIKINLSLHLTAFYQSISNTGWYQKKIAEYTWIFRSEQLPNWKYRAEEKSERCCSPGRE